MRVAVIDLYDNEPNQGMRCIQELLADAGRYLGKDVEFEIFETRYKNEIPDLSFDAYISSGGPGSPFDGLNKPWEATYFRWLDHLWNANQQGAGKHVLFICHSFQMMTRFFEVGQVTRRKSESFGIFPVHTTEAGAQDPLFSGLEDPFYAADFRHWQVVQPDHSRLSELGGSILAIEKKRPRVKLERALMGIRISPELVGVQFHPEADPAGMALHFREPARQAALIEKLGIEKFDRILHRLEHPDFITRTYRAVIPNFLRGVPVPALVG